MAKNKNGQTVKNKKYYKNKNTPKKNHKKKNNTTKKKKIDNNVSIIVDNKKENLNYNIVAEENEIVQEEVKEQVEEKVENEKVQEEVKEQVENEVQEEAKEEEQVENEVQEEAKEEDKEAKTEISFDNYNKEIDNNVPEEKLPDIEEVDYRTKKAKLDRKIKTDFKKDSTTEDKFVFDEKNSSNKNKKKKKKKKLHDEAIVINVNDYHSYTGEGLVDDRVEMPIKISKEIYDKEVVNEDKEIVDKAFENTEQTIGDIDKPAIFKNIVVDDGTFKGFIVKLFVLLIILILSIFFVINFSAKYMSSTTTKDVGYFESSDIDYSLCDGGKCNSGSVITKKINTININFVYGLTFDEKIKFNGKYDIVAKFNISDEKTGDILFTENKDIKKDTFSEKSVQDFEIKEDAILLLDDYKKYLDKYNKDRNSHYVGEVKVNLYVDGVNGKKRVASLLVPLQENQQVEKTIISYQAGDASIEDDGSHYGKVYLYLIIFSLILVIASSIGVVLLLSGAEEEDE